MTTTLSNKGQITIPAPIRRKFNLVPGMLIEFDQTAPFLKATPAFDEKEMRLVLGCCRKDRTGMTAQKWLNETRGVVQLPPARHDHRR